MPAIDTLTRGIQVQHDINPVMRGILVDWLVEVAEEYKLSQENLYLSTNYVDRFLSVMPVLRGRLQLVGVTCMLIASKYEEIFAPQVEDFVYITDSTYSAAEVLQMEVTVLNALRFNLTAVTPYCFLKRLTSVLDFDDQVPAVHVSRVLEEERGESKSSRETFENARSGSRTFSRARTSRPHLSRGDEVGGGGP